MMEHSGVTTSTGLTAVRGEIIALALTTAIIHIVLAIPLTMVGFYLNGLGYIGLVTALYLPQLRGYRHQIRWLLMGYTALTIVLWVILSQPYTLIGVDAPLVRQGLGRGLVD